nr:aminotransferase class I/II-fold pyridoxal phosphate-dependent enzyme [Marinitoga lauensis]
MDIIDKIPFSKTIEINSLAKKLKKEGKNIINLTAGEPDFSTPQIIIEKAKEVLDENAIKYTNSDGIQELKNTISLFLNRKNIMFSSEEIIITNGAKQALFNALISILNEEDEVILFSPFWVSYIPAILLSGAKPVILETNFENAFLPDIEKLEKLITSKTKIIIVNSPNNPTGVVYPKEIIKGLLILLIKMIFLL